MNIAEVYQALEQLENGKDLIDAIKGETSRLNNEAKTTREKLQGQINTLTGERDTLSTRVSELEEQAGAGSNSPEYKQLEKQLKAMSDKFEQAETKAKEAEAKRIAAIRKEQRRIARTEAFFDSLLHQDNVKVSLGTSTLINNVRLFQVVYDLTSTRCSFEDLMQLKEDTGLTVKFEVTRIQHETETVETNYSRGYDSNEYSDTVISSIDSEIIIETYYY